MLQATFGMSNTYCPSFISDLEITFQLLVCRMHISQMKVVTTVAKWASQVTGRSQAKTGNFLVHLKMGWGWGM